MKLIKMPSLSRVCMVNALLNSSHLYFGEDDKMIMPLVLPIYDVIDAT